MVDIFVPVYRDSLRIPARQAIPNPGELVLDCVCGCKEWGIHVAATQAGAQVAEIFCKKCKLAHRVSQTGHVLADGKVNSKGGN